MERELQPNGGEQQRELTPEVTALIEEIKGNARRDRKRVEDLLDRIRERTGEVEPEVAAALAENLSDLTDALTRSNAQLVELVKVQARACRGPRDSLNRDAIYDDIESEMKQ